MIEDTTSPTGFNFMPREKRKRNRKSGKRSFSHIVYKLVKQANLWVIKRDGLVVFKHQDRDLCELIIKNKKTSYTENGITKYVSI